MEEEAPVAEVELVDEPVAELDLDDPHGGDPVGADAWGARRWAVRPAVALGIVGVLLGVGLVHVVGSARERADATVRVALGEAGGALLNRRFGNRRVIRLGTVAVNEGLSAVTVRGVRVDGDGAELTRTFRGEPAVYPFRLDPGETGNMPLALTSDCEVRAPRAPRVTVDVTAEDGTQRAVAVRVPGLDELWRRATSPQACSDA